MQKQKIVDTLKEHGGSMPYKELNELLANEFEGVRLLLKTMKDEGIVDFDGIVPSFSSVITLQ